MLCEGELLDGIFRVSCLEASGFTSCLTTSESRNHDEILNDFDYFDDIGASSDLKRYRKTRKEKVHFICTNKFGGLRVASTESNSTTGSLGFCSNRSLMNHRGLSFELLGSFQHSTLAMAKTACGPKHRGSFKFNTTNVMV